MNRRRVTSLKVTYHVRCHKHPSYMAQREPRSNCIACKGIWRLTHLYFDLRAADIHHVSTEVKYIR